MKTKPLDFDARREPQTDRFCIKCQRDLRTLSGARMIHLVGFAEALHPESETEFIGQVEDQGWWLVGPECVRMIGIEWTHSVDEMKLEVQSERKK